MSSQKNNQPSRQVLLVDGEPEFLRTARDAFASLSVGQWEIHTAGGAESALEKLKQHPVHLLLVDTDIPLLDGIQFLALMGQRYPAMKKVSLCKGGTDEKRKSFLGAGAELFLEKPQSPDSFKALHSALEDLMAWTPQAGQAAGRNLSLPELIQMECLGRNSSVLEVYNDDVLGRIYLENGRIIHAVAGDLMGERALQQLLALPGGQFELVPFEAPLQKTISGTWETVLAEATRLAALKNGEALPTGIDPKTLAATASSVQVLETLICSDSAEPIFQMDCSDVPSRIQFLQTVGRLGARLAEIVPLGAFDRLEIQLTDGRMVAQSRPDRMVFVAVGQGTGKPK